MIKTVAIAGAGTMGSGIAFSAAQSGYNIIVFDTFDGALDRAINSVNKNLKFLEDKGKISASDSKMIFERITFTDQITDVKAELIIEAIVEKLDIKIKLLSDIAEHNSPATIIASNTSSLSINDIQNGLPNPERVGGLHFFNPAHVMKLVEVIKGEKTSQSTIDELLAFSNKLNKVPVVCKDAPGFIVNRVARHFYLESMKAVEEGRAKFEDIDTAMEAVGFKMGPFKLMDMIGMDINLAVSQSLYEAFDNHPRFKPSPIQIEKVSKGQLGRKTGKGFYHYDA